MPRRHRLFTGRNRSLVKPPKKKFPIKLFFTVILFLLPIFILLYILRSPLLKVNQIDCSLNGEVCRESHLALLNQNLNKNYLFVKPSLIEKKMLEQDPSLTDVKVNLIFPNYLKVILTPNSNVITLGILPPQAPPLELEVTQATSSTESSFSRSHPLVIQINALVTDNPTLIGLSSSGSLIDPPSSDTSLYLLDDPQNISKASLLALFQYEQELEKSTLTYQRALFVNPYYILYFRNGTYAIFDTNKPSRISVATLQQIRSVDTINNDRAIIDLRFNKPVISSY